jgi:hypothetical protein
VFTVTGSGKDHWHEDDYFHYVYRPLVGDGEIVVRVASLDKVNGYSAAGVMFRFDPDWNREKPGKITAPGVQFFATASGTVMWGERWVSQNQNSGWQPGGNVGTVEDPAKVPVWFKIQRRGNKFSGYYSADGQTWKAASNDNPKYMRDSDKPIRAIETGPNMWVGLFYCPHDETKSGSATFDNVKVTEGTPPP